MRKALSPARLAANRNNAQKSTGPRTATGKQRSSKNALRHGLNAQDRLEPVDGQPHLQPTEDHGSSRDSKELRIAARESWDKFLRVKQVRGEVLSAACEFARKEGKIDPDEILASAMSFASGELLKLDEYERKAF